jgi:hypothetical protein
MAFEPMRLATTEEEYLDPEGQILEPGELHGEAPVAKPWFTSSVVAKLTVGALVAVAFVTTRVYAPMAPLPTVVYAEDHSSEPANLKDDESVGCHTGTKEWSPVTHTQTQTARAVHKAFMLSSAERTQCTPEIPPFPFDPEDFLRGAEHRHHVYVEHKYSRDCSHETYKMHFYIGSDTDGTTWTQQVTHEIKTKQWKLIASSPRVCDIKVGSASTPQQEDVTSKAVDESTKFALAEIQYRVNQCHGAGKYTLTLSKIKSAVTSILAGVKMDLVLTVAVVTEDTSYFSSGDEVDIPCSVFNRCGGSGECVKQLMLPMPDAVPVDVKPGCGILEAAMAEKWAMPDGPPGKGHIVPDATEMYIKQNLNLFTPSELDEVPSARGFMIDRVIPASAGFVIPSEYDPRSHECLQNIAVYNQGSCGSCYANAMNAMMGIRKCFKDKGMPKCDGCVPTDSRRLFANETIPALEGARRLTEHPGMDDPKFFQKYASDLKAAKSLAETSDLEATTALDATNCPGNGKSPNGCACSGFGDCKTFCCGHDCIQSKGHCQNVGDKPKEVKKAEPAACGDSPTWSAFGAGDYTCAWFKANDPDCNKFTDYGQRSHCKEQCKKCPLTPEQIKAKLEASHANNPWNGAWYQYMPSVSDTAACSKNGDGSVQGCNGGYPNAVWEGFRKSGRDLNIMGDKCMPYNMKCTQSSGVVNPLNGGMCDEYQGYQLWHKPCSCIPGDKRPSGTPSCPSAPSASCGLEAPWIMAQLHTVGQGLSISDAVANMQRHILEFGPLYISFSTTSAFMNWYSKHPKDSVYTGGGHKQGGHAVIVIGWGTKDGVDYWLLRNSWGADWADKGDCKFQRGVNLDSIEEMGVTASFADKTIKDWAPPSCSIRGWSRSWCGASNGCGTPSIGTYKGVKGAYWSPNYRIWFTIRCSKDAHVKAFFSSRLTSRDEIKKGGITGRTLEWDLKERVDFTTPEIELYGTKKDYLSPPAADCIPGERVGRIDGDTSLGFGVEAGDMWVQLSASDGKGNKAESSQFISVPVIDGGF